MQWILVMFYEMGDIYAENIHDQEIKISSENKLE